MRKNRPRAGVRGHTAPSVQTGRLVTAEHPRMDAAGTAWEGVRFGPNGRIHLRCFGRQPEPAPRSRSNHEITTLTQVTSFSTRPGIRAACFALVLASVVACREATTVAQPPHVVLILVDDLGWGDVGYHGSDLETPRIDALARSGARLERFYVHPMCTPTRAALLTGRYPSRYGLHCRVLRPWDEAGLPESEWTLAEALRGAGYRTALCGKWHLGHARAEFLPDRQGFDQSYGSLGPAVDSWTRHNRGELDWYRDGVELREEGYTTDLIAAEAVRILEDVNPRIPLFLYVPFTAPHAPLQAPQEELDRLAAIEDPDRRLFGAVVARLDQAVGRILDALEQRGMRENTLVIFASDNGGTPPADNGPFRGRKSNAFEGGVRVPAVAAWPGRIAAGTVVEEPIHAVDVFPTVVALAGGVPGPRPLDGRDVWATLVDGEPSPHATLLLALDDVQDALIEGSWKLYVQHSGGPDEPQLYDLATDPGEEHDLAAARPEVVERLTRELERLRGEAVACQLER